MLSPKWHVSFVKIKKKCHFMQKVEITQLNQLYSLLSASQWKGDNYNSAQEKGCALERQLLTLNSAKVCSMLFLFFQWFTNGHFQNSEANFRTFLVRNTQVLFLLLWSTYFIRTLAFTYISGKCQMGKTNIVSNTIMYLKYVVGAVNGHIINMDSCS